MSTQDDDASVTSGISAMAGLTAEEKARRKAERQRRIEEQERQMKEVMEQSRSALEIMNELNADGGASVSSLGSGRTHSTGVPAVLEVLDEEAPGPLPTTSTSGKGGSHPPPGHDKFMESRTWGMDSATVERTAPRLSKTESARKFLWDEDDDGAGGAVGGGAGGKTTPGGGGLFSPSSRRQSRESDTEEIERAIDKTIDNVVGSGGDLSGAATSTVSGDERRGSAISKLTSTLRGLAWGMGDGADNNDSMTSINLAPRGEPAPAAPATSTPNRRTAGARMLTNAISHSLRNIQAADSDYDNEKSHGRRILTSVTMSGAATKEWCFNHRRLAVLVAGAAVVIGSVLLIGQNSGVMSPSTESGRGGIGLRPSMPTFHFNSGSKSKKSDRYKAIKASIIRARVSDESDFKDQHTAQSRALDWISNDDEGKLETTDPFILQRYSLAVLWFNTAYSEAEMKRSPYPEKGEEDEEDPTILMETWDDTDYWLTKAGICMFYGVTCHHRPGTPLTEVTYNDNNGVTSLRLMKNNLQGSLPKEIFTGLPDLRVLELQGNDLVGTLPIEIGNLRKIEYLKLENNSLSSTIPTEICLLDRLEHLEIGNNDWTGILPEELGELQQLNALGVFNSQLTGTLPSSLGKLVNMRQLYLDFNQLTGTFPATLAALTNLIDLRLRRNALSGSIPSEIGNLKSLNVLYLDGNELSGTIPSTLNKLNDLTELSLYKNQLTGLLPDLNNLSRLTHFYIDHNALSGFIPSWRLPELKHFFAYNNKFSGKFPSFDGMKNLVKLRLDGNSLTGTLGDEIGELNALEELMVSSNKIEGTLPASLGNLLNLERLVIYRNDITGSVPDEVCTLERNHVLDELVADCDNGGVECSCCTECY